MQRLLKFLYHYRAFILFLVLESLCFWIVVSNNSYQGSKFFNATAGVSASFYDTKKNVQTYFKLAEENQGLIAENARLKQLILESVDTVYVESEMDTQDGHSGIVAKVIDHSLFFKNNYIIINKGYLDGVVAGMGVISPTGIVGQVKSTTQHYAMVSSVLHHRAFVSSLHRSSGALCSTVWNGENPLFANVNYLPRHVQVAVGDTITTSGFNSIYPENYWIGIVDEVSIAENATFYDIRIRLSTDYFKLSYVYLLGLKGKKEIDSLRAKSKMEIDG